MIQDFGGGSGRGRILTDGTVLIIQFYHEFHYHYRLKGIIVICFVICNFVCQQVYVKNYQAGFHRTFF